jgi:hypothetical protein
LMLSIDGPSTETVSSKSGVRRAPRPSRSAAA